MPRLRSLLLVVLLAALVSDAELATIAQGSAMRSARATGRSEDAIASLQNPEAMAEEFVKVLDSVTHDFEENGPDEGLPHGESFINGLKEGHGMSSSDNDGEPWAVQGREQARSVVDEIERNAPRTPASSEDVELESTEDLTESESEADQVAPKNKGKFDLVSAGMNLLRGGLDRYNELRDKVDSAEQKYDGAMKKRVASLVSNVLQAGSGKVQQKHIDKLKLFLLQKTPLKKLTQLQNTIEEKILHFQDQIRMSDQPLYAFVQFLVCCLISGVLIALEFGPFLRALVEDLFVPFGVWYLGLDTRGSFLVLKPGASNNGTKRDYITAEQAEEDAAVVFNYGELFVTIAVFFMSVSTFLGAVFFSFKLKHALEQMFVGDIKVSNEALQQQGITHEQAVRAAQYFREKRRDKKKQMLRDK